MNNVPWDITSHKVVKYPILSLYSLFPHSFLPFFFVVPTVKQKQDVLNQVSLIPMGSACYVVSVLADCMHILSTNIT